MTLLIIFLVSFQNFGAWGETKSFSLSHPYRRRSRGDLFSGKEKIGENRCIVLRKQTSCPDPGGDRTSREELRGLGNV